MSDGPQMRIGTFDPSKCPEVFTRDLVVNRIYILHQRKAAAFRYYGRRGGAYYFYGVNPEGKPIEALLADRPGQDGAIEDAHGVKVTIRKYTGEDQ